MITPVNLRSLLLAMVVGCLVILLEHWSQRRNKL